MIFEGIIWLIDCLCVDFGKDFFIFMVFVVMVMLDFIKNMSGFDYEVFEVMWGKDIVWYNV